ncbi:hypothetical protein [Nostoc sp.]|uniref:hypothetical protein n=1 Tax=Nostoc sp. TaxID=1180 RepID=UPI002FFA35AE
MKRKHLKKHSLMIYWIAAFAIAFLVVLEPLAQKTSSLQNKDYMSHQSGYRSNEQPLSKLSNYQHPLDQFSAEEFYFETRVDFPASVLTNPDKYTESITHKNGNIDITLIDRGDTINYIFQVSSIPKHQCESDGTRACQAGTTSARGNIAEIQIALPGRKLTPGIYPFQEGVSTQGNDDIVYSRQLYSDPSHGKLGCQLWGAGTLNVTRAVYGASGKLEYLDANVNRDCNQTALFPPILPQDVLLHTEIENIESYTYHAVWRCRLVIR